MSDLLQAAKAVIQRWDTPLWKDVPATGEYINRLRDAVDRAENPPTDYDAWFRKSVTEINYRTMGETWKAAQHAERERCREIVIAMGGPDVSELLRQIDSGADRS